MRDQITSVANPRIKSLVALRRHRDRLRAGVILVDGYDELVVALASGSAPQALYYCPPLLRDEQQLCLLERVRSSGAELFELSERAFAKVAYRENPDGWLAVLPQVETALDRLELSEDALLVICEAVEKPGNLGAILRTADAAGVAAVIAAPASTDWGNPNVVRASKGALFTVPVASAELGQALAWLRERSVRIVATTPSADRPFTEEELTGKLAILVGSEQQGLTAAAIGQSDVTVSVPMLGRVNSLNVATTAALLTYEAARQRRLEKSRAGPTTDSGRRSGRG